jgi:hypothetical protein
MMKNLKIWMILAITTSIVFTGCKDDDDDKVDPVTGPPPLYASYEGGFIKGTLSGRTQNGNSFSYDFNYKLEIPANQISEVDSNDGLGPWAFTLVRNEDLNNEAVIEFSMLEKPTTFPLNLTNANSVGLSIEIAVLRKQGDSVYHYPQFTSTDYGSLSTTITDYDEETQTIKGTFNGTDDASTNPSGYDMQVSSGSFEISIRSLLSKPALKNTGVKQESVK